MTSYNIVTLNIAKSTTIVQPALSIDDTDTVSLENTTVTGIVLDNKDGITEILPVTIGNASIYVPDLIITGTIDVTLPSTPSSVTTTESTPEA